jgi:hypothetical protein
VNPFDWKPYLRSEETLLWQGQHNKRRLAFMSLPMIALFVAVIALDDGSGQMRIAAQSAPYVIAFLMIGLFVMSVTDDRYAITNRRAISVRIAPWHKPKVKDCDIGQVTAVKWAKTPLMFRDKQTDAAYVMMTLSNKAVSDVMAVLNGESR